MSDPGSGSLEDSDAEQNSTECTGDSDAEQNSTECTGPEPSESPLERGVVEPARKKPRVGLALSFPADFAATYASAESFPHGVAPRVLPEEVLTRVRDEVLALGNTYKEADLYKMDQSQDLAAVDSDAVRELRDCLYSAETRERIAEVTGLRAAGRALSERVDLSAQLYKRSHHLLVHDDAVGTRAVAFVLYLSDEWAAADGGALEIYGSTAEGAPSLDPVERVLPAWGSLLVFTVLGGRSWHAVAEVLATEKRRIAIQGWYHSDTPAAPARLPSLALPEAAWSEVSGAGAVSAEERAALAEWVTPNYLDKKQQAQVRKFFKANGQVHLHAFLRPDRAKRLRAALDAEPEEGWTRVGPPHLRRYCVYDGPGDAEGGAGAQLAALTRVLGTPAFAKLVRLLTGQTCDAARALVRQFARGRDFTVLAGPSSDPPVVDCSLVFVADAQAEEQERWASEEVGGFEVYTEVGEEGVDLATQEVYGAGEPLLTVPVVSNALSLVARGPGVARFCKYLSAAAPSNRFDIDAAFRCDPA